jgi:hypothetical protein
VLTGVLCLLGLAFLLTSCGSSVATRQPATTRQLVTNVTPALNTAGGAAHATDGSDATYVARSAGTFFAVLDSKRTVEDAVPSVRHGPSAGSQVPLSGDAGVDAARRLSSTSWLAPMSGGRLCLVYIVKALTRGPGGSPLPPALVQQCATVSAAVAGLLVVTQSLSPSSRAGSGAVSILGVVPDGVRRVSVIGRDGHTTSLLVRHNSYAGTVVDPTAVSFSDHVGNTTVSQLIPVASFDGRLARPVP